MLRHQQKLHGGLLNMPRRGGTKDSDVNEHVNILPNNTDANAPLPTARKNSGELVGVFSNESLSASPPRMQTMQGIASKTKTGQQNNFRVSLFNHSSVSSRGHDNSVSGHTESSGLIPSPIATNASQNTPTNISHNSLTINSDLTQQPSPQHSDSPKKGSTKTIQNVPPHLQGSQQGFRHLSFSASSSTSYTNAKDSLNIQQNGNFPMVPSQVEFATPQLAPVELGSKNLFPDLDLNTFDMDMNLDSMDIHSSHNHEHLSDELFLSSGKRSHASIDLPYFDKSGLESFNLHNPNRIHHVRDATPLGIGMYPHDYPTLMHHTMDLHEVKPEQVLTATDQDNNYGLNEIQMLEKRRKKEQEILGHNDIQGLSSMQHRGSDSSSESNWIQGILDSSDHLSIPRASHRIGFTEYPFASTMGDANEIPSLFRTRQLDLVSRLTQEKPTDLNILEDPSIILNYETQGLDITLFNAELRNKIIGSSDIEDSQFPLLHDLNNYTVLYIKEYNRYFPFIHLPTLKNAKVKSSDSIALVLAIVAIGALYNCHDNNFFLLFNLSKLHIQRYFQLEFQKNVESYNKVLMPAHQALVLHIFISIFFNDPHMADQSSKQIKSMLGLFSSTKLNKPLELLLLPPPLIVSVGSKDNIQRNYDFFILAQSRIRTVVYFYLFEVFRSVLMPTKISFTASDIECGTPCLNEFLWSCDNPQSWLSNVDSSTLSVVDFCNGPSLPLLIGDIENQYGEAKLPFSTLLILLLYVLEQVQKEHSKPTTNKTLWRLNSRPKLEALLKSWEAFFIKNGGLLTINDYNSYLLNMNSDFQLILPIYYMTKLRLCIDFTVVCERIVHKDWDGMNEAAKTLDDDMDALRECVQYGINVISLWIHNVKGIKDSRNSTLRTPIVFVTCTFSSFLALSHYLHKLEGTSLHLTDVDKVLWVQCQDVLLKAYAVLSPLSADNSHSKLFQEVSSDFFGDEIYKEKVKELIKLVETESDDQIVQKLMSELKLSIKTLYLGLRVLADAPVWPLAIGFAEALQKRALYFSQN